MPLHTTGSISLDQIRNEFGGATPISISQYYAGGGRVPPGALGTYGNIPASGSSISMQKFFGSPIVNFIMWQIDDTMQGEVISHIQGIDTAPNGDIIITASTNFNNGYALTAKFNKDGFLQWQVRTGNNPWGLVVDTVIDSAGNIYQLWSEFVTSTNTQIPTIIKLNSSGVLQWSRKVKQPSIYSAEGKNIALSPDNLSVYVTTIQDTGNYDERVSVLYSLSANTGLTNWARSMERSAVTSLAVAPNGDIYLSAGHLQVHIGGYQASNILKYNSTGVLQWQKTHTTDEMSINVSPSGALYCVSVNSDPVVAAVRFFTVDTNTGNFISGRALSGTVLGTTPGFGPPYPNAEAPPAPAGVTKLNIDSAGNWYVSISMVYWVNPNGDGYPYYYDIAVRLNAELELLWAGTTTTMERSYDNWGGDTARTLVSPNLTDTSMCISSSHPLRIQKVLKSTPNFIVTPINMPTVDPWVGTSTSTSTVVSAYNHNNDAGGIGVQGGGAVVFLRTLL